MTPIARTRASEARPRALVPDLAAEAFRVGSADEGLDPAGGVPPDGDPRAFRHLLLISIQLDNDSWLWA